VKIVSIIDEHTRECLGGLVERSITANRLIDEPDRIAVGRVYPAALRCDNGPELACSAMSDWATELRPGTLRPAHTANRLSQNLGRSTGSRQGIAPPRSQQP